MSASGADSSSWVVGLAYAGGFSAFGEMAGVPIIHPSVRVSIAISIAAVVLLIGAPIVIGGQLLLVFLEQRRLLARQLAATRRIGRLIEAVRPRTAGPTFGERLRR